MPNEQNKAKEKTNSSEDTEQNQKFGKQNDANARNLCRQQFKDRD